MPHLVDTRPPEPEYGIPEYEQDHDAGRLMQPSDGQEVVNLLSQPGALEEVNASEPEDAQPEPLTDDMGESIQSQNPSIVDMLYGNGGALSSSCMPLR